VQYNLKLLSDCLERGGELLLGVAFGRHHLSVVGDSAVLDSLLPSVNVESAVHLEGVLGIELRTT
jgi:hypothetical protein